jgi:hypothetical protein
LENPSFRSEITYSVQNEDYRTELAVLRHIYRGAPLRVLMIAFGVQHVGRNDSSCTTSVRNYGQPVSTRWSARSRMLICRPGKQFILV